MATYVNITGSFTAGTTGTVTVTPSEPIPYGPTTSGAPLTFNITSNAVSFSLPATDSLTVALVYNFVIKTTLAGVTSVMSYNTTIPKSQASTGINLSQLPYGYTQALPVQGAGAGLATLSAGSVTVANSSVTALSIIRVSTYNPAGTVGAPYVFSKTAGTGFTVKSTSGSDTSTIYYEIVQY